MACFYIRFKEGNHVLRHEVEFPDLEAAQNGARKGAKHLLWLRTGRDPTPDAVIILDSNGPEVESAGLLDALHDVLRDRTL
jgi:hypothetical protein